jgi:glycosyltransferase involved in cell wall biosynthesis
VRIAFLTQVLPYPLDAGPKVRAYHVLRHLAQSHEVTLVSFVRSTDTADAVDHLKQFCQDVCTVGLRRSARRDARFLARSLLMGRSFIISRDTVPKMHRLVEALPRGARGAGRPYDAVHCDQLWMAQYGLRANGVRRVLDQHNAVYLILRRMARLERNPVKRALLEREWRMLARYETWACQRFDQIITVTEHDRRMLDDAASGDLPPVSVIPICVEPSAVPVVRRWRDSRTVLHLGTMHWPPNVEGVLWFAREVFPFVRERIPGMRFCVVGARPPARVRRLAADAGVEVAGYVDDPLPYVERSAVFIVPVHAGGGMRVKILDAWMWGIPIVSTTIGAEGIDIAPGENIIIADEPRAFAEGVLRLVGDAAAGDQLAANGRAWVEQRYDWRQVYGALDEVYAQL